MKLNYTKFDYMKMNNDLNVNNAKYEIVDAIQYEVIDRMYQTAEAIGNMNISLDNHATVRERDQKDIMDKINESLKQEEEYRTRNVCKQQDGDCFDMALKDSKRFLESQGHVLKKTMDFKRK